ncbi:MAG: DNA-3-methyladenine glycosylase [Pirellulales bacterium]
MGLQYDPDEAVEVLKRADKRLARVIKRAGPFTHRPEPTRNSFQYLMRAIVYQQLAGKAAATIYGRVEALFPGRGGPKPEAVLATPDKALRGAGLSQNKMLSVKDLAAKTLEGVVPTMARLQKMSDEEIVARLVQVRGIGPWSVEMLLIFRLGRPDVLPVSDFGVRKGFMHTYGATEMPTPKELLAHGERWRPYRSVASWYMWRAVDLAQADASKAKNGKQKLPT